MLNKLFASFVLCATAATATAQPRATDEILVTGERVARTLQETASSVVVVSARDLDALASPDRIEQLLPIVSNMQLGSGGEGPTIRGQDTTGVLRDLPAFLGGNRPRTTLQVDGRAVSYNEFVFGATALWDVEKVEIFRSPQTTTQGANSIAGAIFIETGAPTFDWHGRARLLTGNYDTRQASLSVSGPLVEDQLAIRVAADVRRHETSSHITSPARGINPNRDDYDLGRLKLLYTPPWLPELAITGTATHTRSQAPQIEGIVAPFAARRDPAATYGIFRTRVDAVTLHGSFQSGNVLVNATSSYGNAAFRRFAPPGFGEAENHARDYSTELTAQWQVRNVFSLLGGTRLSRSHLKQAIDLSAALLGRGAFVDDQYSLGVFGEASGRILSRLSLTGGARYQRDRQVRDGRIGTGTPISLNYDHTFSRFLPKLTIAYQASRALTAGLLVQRAYNPGGTTLGIATGIADTFRAETLWNTEAFARASFSDGRLTISGNIFNYRIRDAQRSLLREVSTVGGTVFLADIDNAPSGESQGAEVEVRWRPSMQFFMDAGIGLLRTRLTRTLGPKDPLNGKEFQRAPRFTGSLRAGWRPTQHLQISGVLRHNSGYFSDDANDPLRHVSGATAADANARWTRGPLTVSAYMRNVADKLYLTYIYAPSTRRATAGDPREFGFAFEAAF